MKWAWAKAAPPQPKERKDVRTAATLDECDAPTPRRAFFDGIRAGNLALVQDALKHHPDAVTWREIRDDIHIADSYGLHIAVREGKLDIVKALTGAGAEVDAGDCGGASALMHAIKYGQKAVFRYLLEEAGANPDHADRAGEKPILSAASENDAEAIAMLLAKGAKVNAHRGGMTGLFYAVRDNAPDAIRVLIVDGGIRDDMMNVAGKTARQCAMDAGRPQLAALIDACMIERKEVEARLAREESERAVAQMSGATQRSVTVGHPLSFRPPSFRPGGAS